MKYLSLLTLLAIFLTSCAPKPTATATPMSKSNIVHYEATPVRYIISEIVPINESVTADNIEMRWEKVQFLATGHVPDEKQSLSVEAYICFEKPKIDGDDNWTISSSKLSIRNKNAKMNSYALIYDSKRSFMFEDISPNWKPKDKEKSCIRATYPFEASSDIVRQLAVSLDVTTRLSLTISELKEFDSPYNSFDGPWVFDTIINP